MKKVKFTGKLSLNKETIAKLNDEQMGLINGGATVKTKNCNSYAWEVGTRNTCACACPCHEGNSKM